MGECLCMSDPNKGTDYLQNVLEAPETAQEKALRPLSFADFSGQGKTIERLQVMVGAARSRSEALNHIPPARPARTGQDHARRSFSVAKWARRSGRPPAPWSRNRATWPDS